jgi:hypothetical protein
MKYSALLLVVVVVDSETVAVIIKLKKWGEWFA